MENENDFSILLGTQSVPGRAFFVLGLQPTFPGVCVSWFFFVGGVLALP